MKQLFVMIGIHLGLIKISKKLINDKNHAYKSYRQNENNSLTFQNFQFLQSKLNSLIEESKHKYHARLTKKLSDPATSPKSYWSILRTFLNNNKIPCIPPLLHEINFIIDFKRKAEIFNTFFAKQCSLINTSSILPTTLIMKTRGSLSTIRFTSVDILKIIRNLDPNKAHGHDMISIRMVKLCNASLCKPLELIFKSCFEGGKFPLEWKKANVFPAYKKGDKQLLKNYRPISLLAIAGKIFERTLFNNMFEFFTKNHLISHSQSRFKPGNSCINQLLSITHERYKLFDDGLDVRGVFLDISKAFDKVWHKGLLYRLKQNGVSGNLLDTITDFLNYRKQRVALKGQFSSWTSIEAGVPQGSILGPLLFLIYINDLSDDLMSNVKLFADDTSLFSVVHDVNTSSTNLNNDLRKISDLTMQRKMSFNPDSSKQAQEVIFSRKRQNPNHDSIYFINNLVNQVHSQRHFGMHLDAKLNFEKHLYNIMSTVAKTIGLLRKLQAVLPRPSLVIIYKTFKRPHLDYGDIIYDRAYNESFHQKLESTQYNALLAITGAIRGTSRAKIYQELGLESLQERPWYRKLCYFLKIFKGQSPDYLFKILPSIKRADNTKNVDHILCYNTRHNFFRNSIFPSTLIERNNLDINITNSESYAIFKKSVLRFIRPSENPIFSCHNSSGIKLITRLRLGFSHLREHKFRHNFQDTLNPICSCGENIETTTHYLLHCPNYLNERTTLWNNLQNIDENILDRNYFLLLYSFLVILLSTMQKAQVF